MFDLGSSSSFSLTEKSALKLAVSKKTIEIEGLHSEGGNGVLVQKAQLFKADSIDISGVVFKNRPVSYSSKNVYNLIGNPVIKYFIVTLNFKDSELYLSPMPGTNLPDGWNSFGFAAEFKSNRIVVTSIFKGLSADKAGLRIDDEIETVNGQPLNCKSYCECKTILENMPEVNEKLNLKVIEGETIKEITVVKEKVY
jgi:PDZ domain